MTPDDRRDPLGELLRETLAEPEIDAAALVRIRAAALETFQTDDRQTLRNQSMFTLAWRAVAASAAAASALIAWVVSLNPTLENDKVLGRVDRVQGVAAVKPADRQRWTPLRANETILPGDRLRVESRGANAASVVLGGQSRARFGPGSTAEFASPNSIRLLEGEVEITPPAKESVIVAGPDAKKVAVNAATRFAVRGESLQELKAEPKWLIAFRGESADESLGSLITQVDGRDVSLSVGYHNVTVDIRDQIARTVIEESFVNHTDGRLEGVFHFPLSAGASVSGFGMWIGNELVEADVVEKQRAREIYETILREKRDPGLLEWTGGNVFKARVFPIEPRSEKRVKITYTQVLPLEGTKYRYGYALRSELLRRNPLRELNVRLTVQSALPLRSVKCPSHSAATCNVTANAGRVEFSARDYTPDRDFEAVVELAAPPPAVTLLPHRRGEDGYFLLQLAPPSESGSDTRMTLPDGGPMNVIVLADTSASMDAAARSKQAAFLAALTGALTPADRINVATCDVTCEWAFEQARPVDTVTRDHVNTFVNSRASLGWSDLGAAVIAATKRAGPGAHVVYVGDGMPVTVTADAAEFARRIRADATSGATFHAVAVSNAVDAVALNAIASLGGGSVRHVGGERTPAEAALELLNEIARPAVRDVKVEFRGLRVARVYPDPLPNLPAGAQQIVVGRYLPNGRDQTGEVIVTGQRGSEMVRYTTRVNLADAEAGNSFIPRLWARHHLDALLSQGMNYSVRDEIIALSQDYQIMTPYTSFLVLETDADRQRFAVKRTFRMRDGETFFVAGRDKAEFELVRQQVLRAGAWRQGLRREVLTRLNELARPLAEPRNRTRLGRGNITYLSSLRQRQSGLREDEYLDRNEDELSVGLSVEFGGTKVLRELSELDLGEIRDYAVDELRRKQSNEMYYAGRGKDHYLISDAIEFISAGQFDGLATADRKELMSIQNSLEDLAENLTESGGYGGGRGLSGLERYNRFAYPSARPSPQPSEPLPDLERFFPPLPSSPNEAVAPPPHWPAEASRQSRDLLRTDDIRRLPGLTLVHESEDYDAFHGSLTSRRRVEVTTSRDSWVSLDRRDDDLIRVDWCDATKRGAYYPALRLGRERAATAVDVTQPPCPLDDYSSQPLDQTYANLKATVERPKPDVAILVLTPRRRGYNRMTRVTIDTNRRVIMTIENTGDGSKSAVRFTDFREVAGRWWATKIEHVDSDNRLSRRETLTIRPLDEAAVRQQLQDAREQRKSVRHLREPAPAVTEAKAALAANKATFDDHFTLMLHFARSQQWSRVITHLEACEKFADAPAGLAWARDTVLSQARRHDELRQRLLARADELARGGDEALSLAERTHILASRVLEPAEMLTLSDRVKSIYHSQPPYLRAAFRWAEGRTQQLYRLGRHDEQLKLTRQLAVDEPTNAAAQRRYAAALTETGDTTAALHWLTDAIKRQWTAREDQSLRSEIAELLRRRGDYANRASFYAEWASRNPNEEAVYAQYLEALVWNDEAARADELTSQWLREPGDTPASVARFRAAAGRALGDPRPVRTRQVEVRWIESLAAAARRFALHPALNDMARTIAQRGEIRGTAVGRELRIFVVDLIERGIDSLHPEDLISISSWLERDDVPAERWTRWFDLLTKRWATTPDALDRHELGEAVLNLVTHFQGVMPANDFLRLMLRDGPEQYRANYANQLFHWIANQPWTDELETELFGLLPKLTDAKEPADRLPITVPALHHLVDSAVSSLTKSAVGKIERPDQLPRAELQKLQEQAKRGSWAAFADRLKSRAETAPAELRPWVALERLTLEIRAGRDAKPILADCWSLLGNDVKSPADDTAKSLRSWALTLLMHMLTKPEADAAAAERLTAYLARGEAVEPKERIWKSRIVDWFVARDKPVDLERELRRWTEAAPDESTWKVMLAYIVAEQGRLAEAITLAEAVEKADELAPATYRALAGWYRAVNRKADFDRAAAAADHAEAESTLSRRLNAFLNPWRRGRQLPSELDPEVLRTFRVLFEKSATPASYVWQLGEFYKACRDFRLLTGLADAVIGQTPARAYPFLAAAQPVISGILEEATVDELCARIETLRSSAKSSVDRRALDLLEALARRRTAELRNQAGPHAQAAVHALKRSFDYPFTPDERRPLATLLSGLGAVPQPDFAREQLRQLEALHRDAGGEDRLPVARSFAAALHAHGRTDEAIDLLLVDLRATRDQRGGTIPTSAHDSLNDLADLLEGRQHYARAEAVLIEFGRQPITQFQAHWFFDRLMRCHVAAVHHGGATSLGNGRALVNAAAQRIEAAMTTPDHDHRYLLVQRLCDLHSAAHTANLDTAASFRAFAFQRLQPALSRQTNHYVDTVEYVARTIHTLLGPRDAIAFLLDRIDGEPAWFRLVHQGGWHRYATSLAYWRHEAGGDPDPTGRLLKLVLAALRSNLLHGNHQPDTVYRRRHSYYWPEKEADFARAAEDVLAAQGDRLDVLRRGVRYLFRDLDRHDRAIELMLAARANGRLDESATVELIDYLQEAKRFAESIALLQPIVEKHPDDFGHRVRLLTAYGQTKRAADFDQLLTATEKRLRDTKTWRTDAAGRLGQLCLDFDRPKRAVEFLTEAVTLRQRENPRSFGDDTLARLYEQLARTQANLGDTDKAVEAASGAIVTVGNRQPRRNETVAALRSVINMCGDIDAFARRLDEAAAKTGRDNFFARRELGRMLLERKRSATALPQLRLASELQPDDGDTLQLILNCYDQLNDMNSAVAYLMATKDNWPRDSARYADLGRRLIKLGRPGDAERAYTSIVELQPNEAESHAALAEIRQRQGRGHDAILHWQRVVTIRALEPTGLLKLAAAQIQEKRFADAEATVKKLRAKSWPEHFGNVGQEIAALEKSLSDARR